MVSSNRIYKGDAIATNDKPSVGGSKDVRMNKLSITNLRFVLSHAADKTLSLTKREITRGNWNRKPNNEEVMIICDKKVDISHIFLIPKFSFTFAKSSNE